MKRLKVFLLIAMVCAFCSACGATETNQVKETNTTETVQVVLPDSASEIITDFFVDISFEDEIPVISMYDYSDDMLSAILAYIYTMTGAMEVVDDCLIYIHTAEEVVETSLQEQMQASGIGDAKMPEKYITYIKENNLDGEGTYDGFEVVDEATVTLIEENVKLYVVDVIKEQYGESLAEENIETETSQIENEDEKKIIKNEVYEAEEVEVTMSLSQDTENDYHLSIWISSEVEWKLAYSYIICKNMMSVDPIIKLNPVVLATNKEVMLTSLGTSFANETIIDAGEWCVDKMLTGGYDAEAAELLTDELQNMLFDFLELK